MTFHLEAMDPAARLEEVSLAFQTIAEPPPGAGVVRLPQVPGYQVLREVGRGGMGVVYLAHDEALKRNVALKMILAGPLAEPDTLNRFRLESQAIARLQHPNIVQIYEVGSWEGNPYFALEYLPGGTLRQFTAGKPQQPQWAAEVVLQLAEAMAFAHQQGIIHRDLKPANILLDKKMVPASSPSSVSGSSAASAAVPRLIPKITDFGLAKFDPALNCLEQDNEHAGARTKTGEVVGTPNYMAPEQAQGRSHQIGPLADIYSLGAILYELLTGQPPFSGPSPAETLVRVLTEEPLPVRKLQPSVPRDLDVICMKCLRKEPFHRYLTAQSLAEDLQHFLHEEPIIARPVPLWERTWKWAKRRPATAVLTLLIMAAIVMILGGGWYYSTHLQVALKQAKLAEETAKLNAKRAEQNAILAEKQRLLADDQRRLAMHALNQLVYEVQEKLKNRPETRALRQALLNTAIEGLREIAKSTAANDPEISRVEAHIQLGQLFTQLSQVDEAAAQYRHAERISQALLKQPAVDPRVKKHFVETQLWFIQQALHRHDIQEARNVAEPLAAFVNEWLDQEPDSIAALNYTTLVLEKMGHVHHWVHEIPPAWDCFVRGYQLAERWQKLDPQSRSPLHSQVMFLNWLGKICVDRKHWDRAMEYFEKARGLAEQLLEAAPFSPDYHFILITALDEMAEIERHLGRLDQARVYLLEVLSRLRMLAQRDPEHTQRQINVAYALINLASFENNCANFPQAIRYFEEVLAHLDHLDKQGRLRGYTAFEPSEREKFRESVRLARLIVEDAPEQAKESEAVQLMLLVNRIQWLGFEGKHAELEKQLDRLVHWPASLPEEKVHKARECGRAVIIIRGNPPFFELMPGGAVWRDRLITTIVDELRAAMAMGQTYTRAHVDRDAKLSLLKKHPLFGPFYESLAP